VVKNRRTSNVL